MSIKFQPGDIISWTVKNAKILAIEDGVPVAIDDNGFLQFMPPEAELVWRRKYQNDDVVVVRATQQRGTVLDATYLPHWKFGSYLVQLDGQQDSFDEDMIELYQNQPTISEESPMNDCQHNRYSTAIIKAPTKRPEVFLYQGGLQTVGKYDGQLDGQYGAGSAEATRAFQDANDLEDDGIIGRTTATELIRQATAVGFRPDLSLRIMSVIAMYEVSNRHNAFGMAENDIGDNAGANYGIFQCNSFGSVRTMLKLAGRDDLVGVYNAASKEVVNPDIRDWFGSTEGIATQIQFFEQKTLKYGMRELRAFGSFDTWEYDSTMRVWWERAVLLFCDSIIQNGTMWSSRRRPFWKDLVGAEGRPAAQRVRELYHGTWWDQTLGKYIQYEDFKTKWWAENQGQLEVDSNSKAACKATTIVVVSDIVDSIPADDPASRLLVLAQTRSRSSSPTWWYQAVASRRCTDATGTSAAHPSGVVNGMEIDLACDYQI